MNKPRQKSPPGSPPRAVDLEKSLAELESIVEQLESGELPLDKSLKEFERGVRLSRECQGALKDAEQRVQVLMGGELRDFASDDQEGDEDPADDAEDEPEDDDLQ
ncbi:MAG: exodeoxyribonuclease VII small subunit [Chromatiales bacterium]|nr:exodeoxyribonuclease VII small subunit [Chromatiales bacterium]